MADGAQAISNAAFQVFGENLVRLMCWSHCHKAYMDKMKKLVKNEGRRDKIDSDLKSLQWMAQNEEECRILLGLVAEKHIAEASAAESEGVTEFFRYFQEQWGDQSHTGKWFEAAHPYHDSGLYILHESTQMCIKVPRCISEVPRSTG